MRCNNFTFIPSKIRNIKNQLLKQKNHEKDQSNFYRGRRAIHLVRC